MAKQCTIYWQSIIICQLIVHWLLIVKIKKQKLDSVFVGTVLSNKSKLIIRIAQL
jgi:hypothetical protein